MKHIKVVMLLMKNVSHPTIIKGESQKWLSVWFVNGNGSPKLLALVCVSIKINLLKSSGFSTYQQV